ncbi:MAG: AbrB/MazE/SpoVT family DNA-binding domain-containing protein [Lachnospiraceae bacterium]|jgi:Growth regulator|nr:AbrB/MazE/SpoVT family DNA-binding domain-containing protein [Lachnospiraceae bacterium]MBR3638042.1 AbrB/MazE/SpoVT family DNA-binding domain-containing protein [Lachnospiraceae bacterium]
METGIKNWGNSQGIRIPKEFLTQLGITTDTVLDIRIENENIVISKVFRHKTLEERIKISGKPLENSGEFDYGKPEGREVW